MTGQHAARRYRVTGSHTRSYELPMCLTAGDAVTVERWDTTWPAWVWCSRRGEPSGWVPEAFLAVSPDGTAQVLRDYSSLELTVTPGDIVMGLEIVGGWIRCRSEHGDEGWVPEENCSRREDG